MCQTYNDLTSSDAPDIFGINKNQKHILNQLIHFALKNWEACKIWYCKLCCSTIKKNSTFCLILRPWKKAKSPAYGTDYVQNICDKTNLKSKANASCTVQRND